VTPEAKVKKQVKKILDELNCYYFFPATGGFGKSGVPDVVACVGGKFIGIECKANGGKTTLLQEKNLKDIEYNGGLPLVINENNVGELKDILATWLDN
jgi:Holliday junction resolvase